MDLYGEVVTHKSLGKGVIVPDPDGADKNGDYVCVEFMNDGVKRLFPFQNSFVAGWLMTESTKINAYLKNVFSNSSCSKCGKVSVEVDINNGKVYCNECNKFQSSCFDCGKTITKVDAFLHRGNNYCRTCYKNLTDICAECGNIISSETILGTTYAGGRPICYECASEYSSCYFCERLLKDEHVRSVQYSTLCPECYDRYVKKCTQCGDEYIDEEGDRNICHTCFAQNHYRKSISVDLSQAVIYRMKFSNFRQYNDCVSLMTKVARGCEPYRSRYTNTKEIAEKIIDYLILTGNTYSLVITSRVERKVGWQYRGGLTLTELKRVGMQYVLEQQREQECHTVPFVGGKQLHVWEWPYTMRAISQFDTDYGANRNQYGDTSDFYIIVLV